MWATLIGSLAGIVGVAMGAFLGRASADRHWRNDRRLDGFVAYTAMSSARYDLLRKKLESDLPEIERVELANRDQVGRSTVHLLASKPTRDAMEVLAHLVSVTTPDSPPEHHSSVIAALAAYTRAARQELGSKDK